MRDRHNPFEFLFAILQIDGIENRLALAIRQRQLDRRGIGRVNHHRRFHFADQLFIKPRNVLLLVALRALQAHVHDMRPATHLSSRNLARLFPLFLGHQILE